MCRSMVDIHSATAEIRRGKKDRRRRKKPQGKNIMACPIHYGGHKMRHNLVAEVMIMARSQVVCTQWVWTDSVEQTAGVHIFSCTALIGDRKGIQPV